LSPGGKIDWAHHYGAADLALGEAIAMADAVEIADKLTSDQDTLIIVTADHSHTMSIAGYPQRGNPILGIVMYDFVMSKPILGIVMYDSVISKPILGIVMYDSIMSKPILGILMYDSVIWKPILGIVMYDSVIWKPILGIVMYDSVLSKTSFRYCNVRFRHVKNQF
jgi:hypothetical protein